MIHELKIDPAPFIKIRAGVKKFELRLNDRNFRVGDLLWLRRTTRSAKEMVHFELKPQYTGDELVVKVLDIHDDTSFGLEDGYVIMSIGILDVKE